MKLLILYLSRSRDRRHRPVLGWYAGRYGGRVANEILLSPWFRGIVIPFIKKKKVLPPFSNFEQVVWCGAVGSLPSTEQTFHLSKKSKIHGGSLNLSRGAIAVTELPK